MATDILKLFTSLGLTATESKVYLASLSLGPTSVQEIAKKAKLSRTATYAAIEVLQQRGLMSTHERGKKNYFSAEEPENALAQFRGHVKQMEEQIAVLERALPEVKMMAGGERPSVRFYEGIEALYAVFRDVDKLHPEFMYEVANLDDVYSFLDSKILTDARKLLDPKKTRVRILHRGAIRTPNPDIEFRELPQKFGEFHGDIWLYGNRVAFVTFVGKIVTIIIESEPFSSTARVLFDVAWNASHPSQTLPVSDKKKTS